MRDIFFFLGNEPFGTGRVFFKRARHLGLTPVLLSTQPERYGSLSGYRSLKLAETSDAAVLEAIDSLGRNRVGGVWSLRHAESVLAARVSKAINGHGADPDAVEICLDKFTTRQVLTEAGFSDVEFALVHCGDEALRTATALGGPVVLKPRAGTGSSGVRLCRSSEEARNYFDYLAEQRPELRESGVLMEALADGEQFSVQIFDGRSIGVTRQVLGPPPSFLTVGLDFPWLGDAHMHSEIVKHAERAVAAVGHIRGPASVDIRYNSRPRIVEINPRLAGDKIPENIRLATGIDTVEATIRFACGMPYDLAASHNRGSATRWLLRPDAPVRNIRGRERASGLAGISEVSLFRGWYGREGPVTGYKDRLAFVIAEADTVAKAGEIADRGLRQLRVKPSFKRWVPSQLRFRTENRSIRHVVDGVPAWRGIFRSPLSHSVVCDEGSLEALEPEWEDLFQRAKFRTPFMRYSWVRLCWERQRANGAGLFVVVVREGGRPVLIAPLVVEPRRGRWRLRFLDSLTPQYNDVLVESSGKAPEYVAYLWETLAAVGWLRRFTAKWVRQESPLSRHLAKARQVSEVKTYKASYIDLSRFGTFEAYLRSRSRKLRQDHGRRLRRLAEASVEFRFATAKTLDRDMAWLFAHKREWLDRSGKSARWIAEPGTEELFTEAAREGLGSGRAWLTVLSAAGEIIAAHLCFREDPILYLSKSTYDRAWHRYSPARTLWLLNIERAFEEGLQGCDLMTGRGEWKDRLETGSNRVRNWEIRLRRS